MAYATNAGGHNVQLLTSDDLQVWEDRGDALPTLPPWAAPGFTWAPAVLPRPDGFVLYYTVREPRSGRQVISAATASSATGTFADRSGGPLVFQEAEGGSIDPSPFVDADGAAYLLWKADANAIGRPSSLWIQRLQPDGLTLSGSPTRLLGVEAGWEEPLIEAPALVRTGTVYHLFYSGGWWESGRYAIGHATGSSPLGPFTRTGAGRPWRAGQPWWWAARRLAAPAAVDRRLGGTAGPGGQELFTDHAGRLRMAYHAWRPRRIGYAQGGVRELHLATVIFDAAGPPLTS